MGLMAQLNLPLRVVGEERMCMTPPQGFLCESYPPNLIASFLRAGTLLLICVSPTKADYALDNVGAQ